MAWRSSSARTRRSSRRTTPSASSGSSTTPATRPTPTSPRPSAYSSTRSGTRGTPTTPSTTSAWTSTASCPRRTWRCRTGASTAPCRRASGRSYDAGSRALSVTLAFHDQQPRRRGPYNVTTAVDLREAGLPQDAAIGFSAATGDYVERHQILSWSFESTLAKLAVVDDGTAGGRTSNNIGLIAGLTSTAGVVVLVLAVAVAALLRRRRHLKEQTRSIDGDMMDHEFVKGTGPRRFTYTQLSQATRGFSDDHKLGEGGFGSVYRGVLPPDQLGLQVAVKRVSKTSRQERREYISEVIIISRLRHRNLVQLIGWCHEANEQLLVYELMTNGSLKSSTTTSRARRAPYPHPDMAGQVQHHPRDGVGASVPSLGVGAVRGAPRHQAHQHDARRVLQRQVWRLRPRQAHRPRATWTRSPWRAAAPALPPTSTASVSSSSRQPAAGSPWSRRRTRARCCSCAGSGTCTGEASSSTRLTRGCPASSTRWRWSTCCSWGSGVHPDHAARPSIRHAMNVLQLQAPLPDLPLEITVASVACRRDTPRGVTADGDIRRRPARWQPTPQHILLSPPVRRGVHRETVSVNPR
ncbi:hypothetical protein BS78_05G262400 [Paspalum vaginatum]|nr:hypothetical protein BS78_05G262400 [Paspalum vaginatum]